MGILLITWNFPPRTGGIESLIYNLAARLRKQHTVYIITAHARGRRSPSKDVFRATRAGLAAFAGYALWRGASLLASDRRIGVVMGGSAVATPLVVSLARLFRRRAVVYAHGRDVMYRHLLYRAACVRWMKWCDRVVVNSRFTGALVEEQGVFARRIEVINPGIDAGRLGAPRDTRQTQVRHGLEGRRVVLFVGRLAKRKGVEEFVRFSLPGIAREMPEVCFVVAGDNPTDSLSHREDVLSAIRSAADGALCRHVRLLGQVDDEELLDLYHACDLLVLPAIDDPGDVEGFGTVLLEAAAAGKPAVATRTGGIPEAVEDGKTGVLVEPSDYRGLSAVTLDLLRDHARRRTLGLNAQRRVVEQFTWDAIGARYERLFEHLADENRAEERASQRQQ